MQRASVTSVTVGMGYVPDVQFAPFYLAVQRGYYRQAGLDVHFQFAIEPNLLRLASVGKVDFVNAGGDEVLKARAEGLHVRYVVTQYARFPTAIFSLKKSGIRSPKDLKGHTIGIPYQFGASYVGLLALLQYAHLSRSSVKIESIGFKQVTEVAQHQVDAGVGYAMNEPIQLRRQGYAVNEIDVYRWANIAGAGLSASDSMIAHHPAIVRAFVRATARGLRDTLAHPDAAFAAAAAAVPEIRAQASVQRAILGRALAFMAPASGRPVGYVDPTIWSTTARLLYQFKQISRHISAGQAYTNRFVSGT